MKMPRARTILRWSCTVLTPLLGVAWIGSMWLGVTGTWRTAEHSRTAAMFSGTLCLINGPGGEPVVVTDSWRLHGPKAFWWFQYSVRAQQTNAVIPLWIPFAASLGMCGWLWTTETRRNVRSGCCPCGYERVGLAPNVPCPECGVSGA